MTTKEKCELAIKKGFKYNLTNGKIFGILGKEIIGKCGNGYIRLEIIRKKIYLKGHQFAWFYINKYIPEEIDHINGIRTDNRIDNLRAVTRQQNQWNRTTAKGYCWNKNANKFMAQITVNKKQIHLGYYETEYDAHKSYIKAKQKYHII